MAKSFKSIAFTLGSEDIGGGTNVIFEHSTRLMDMGYKVYIVMDHAKDDSKLFWFPKAKELEFVTYEQAGQMSFDILIITFWRTIYEAFSIPADKYVYFVQSIESRFYPEHEQPIRKLADATYTLNMPVITEASWIKQHLEEGFGRSVGLVLNGMNKDKYTEQGEAYAPRDPDKLRVLIEGPLGVFFKNTEKTIELCAHSDADEVWWLTHTNVDSYQGVDRVISRIPIFDTPKVYRSCDVIVKLSYVEGMFGPPLEIFHCGGTAIVYDVTGHEEYIKHNENALVVKTDDEQQVIDYINQLKSDPELLARLKKGARATADEWYDWAAAAAKFEQALKWAYEQHCDSQQQLARNAEFFFDWYTQYVKGTDSRLIRLLRRLKRVPGLNLIARVGYWILLGIVTLKDKINHLLKTRG